MKLKKLLILSIVFSGVLLISCSKQDAIYTAEETYVLDYLHTNTYKYGSETMFFKERYIHPAMQSVKLDNVVTGIHLHGKVDISIGAGVPSEYFYAISNNGEYLTTYQMANTWGATYQNYKFNIIDENTFTLQPTKPIFNREFGELQTWIKQ